MKKMNTWSKVRAPASAQVSLVAPETEQPVSEVFIEAVVSTMSMTLADFPTPPLTPAVAVAVIVWSAVRQNRRRPAVSAPAATRRWRWRYPCRCTTRVLVRHFNFG